VLLTGIASLYSFSTGKTFAGGFMLGLSIVIKPVLFFTIVFLIIATTPILKKLKMLVAIFIPFVLDAIIFLSTPRLLVDFVSRNLSEFELWRSYASTSLTSMLNMIFNANTSISFLCLSIGLIVVGISALQGIHDIYRRITFCFAFGMLSFMIAQAQVWPQNLLVLVPLLHVANSTIHVSRRELLFYTCLVYQTTTVLFIRDFFPPFAVVEPFVLIFNVFILLFITGVVVLGLRDSLPHRSNVTNGKI
jgi:hypothetical protein